MCYKNTKFYSNSKRNNNKNVAQRIAYYALILPPTFTSRWQHRVLLYNDCVALVTQINTLFFKVVYATNKKYTATRCGIFAIFCLIKIMLCKYKVNYRHVSNSEYFIIKYLK